MDFLKIACEYHNLGFNVIPVGGNKRPLSIAAGTQLPTDDPQKPLLIFEKTQPLPWGAGGMKFDSLRQSEKVLKALPWSKAKGIAAICGEVSGYALCVDFDNFPELVIPLQFLAKLDFDQAYTWVYRTGGGFQAWFRCPDFALPNVNKLDRKAITASIADPVKEDVIKFPHIELRWNGHYSILPPSLHPSGKRYAFVQDSMPNAVPASLAMSLLMEAYDNVTVKEEQLQVPLPSAVPATNGNKRKAKGAGLSAEDIKKKYLEAAIHGEVNKLNGSPSGHGNDDLYESAMKLGGFVKGGELGESEFYRVLMATGAASRRLEGEARATIASGLKNAVARTVPEPEPKRSLKKIRQNDAHLSISAVLELANDDESPFPYTIDKKRIKLIKLRQGKEGIEMELQAIADFTARIVQQIRDEQETVTFLIEGETIHGKKFSVNITAEDFANTSRLAIILDAAAGANAGVVPGMEKYLRHAIKKLSGTATPEIHSFKRTGWWEGRFLLPGRGFTDAIITLPSDLPFKLSDTAQMDKALEALEALINSMGARNSLPVLMSIFGAPLAELAGYRDERYTTLIHGRTGKFKTTFTQTALCIYGEGFARDKALIKWGDGATENAIEAIASHAHDLPILVDNYKPNTGGGEKVLVRVIHRMSEGGAKKRLNRDAELRETPDLYAWLLMTGEDTSISDTAMIARQLWVSFDKQPANSSDLLSQAQDNVKHLPAIGRTWIEFLESSEGQKVIQQLVEKLRTVQKDVLKQLLDANPSITSSNPQRLARNIAYNRMVFAVLCQHPVLSEIFKRFERDYIESICAIGDAMAGKAVESNPALVFVQGLRYAIHSGKAILLENTSASSVGDIEESESRRMIGYKAPNGGAYLLPPNTRLAVEDMLGKDALAATTPHALYKRLEELGYLASSAKDGHLVVKKIRGVPMRVLHLNELALKPDEDEAAEHSIEI